MENKIKVGVRYRPLNTQECDNGSEAIVRKDSSANRIYLFDNNKCQSIKNTQNKQSFDFDWVFRDDSSQRLVYESMCKPLVQNIFDGFNGTFFACTSINNKALLYTNTVFIANNFIYFI
jgi:hypothetical protein